MKDSFIFYRSFYECLKGLPDESRVRIYDNICEMALNGNDIDGLQGIEANIFTLIRPQIEANYKRFINGLKGGRPMVKHNVKPMVKHNTKANVNDNVNDNDNKVRKKNKYGSFENVLLSDDEYQKLKDRFSNYEEKIENLSNYIASKGDKYKSHYATILNWSREESKNIPKWLDKKIEKKESDEIEDLLKGF